MESIGMRAGCRTERKKSITLICAVLCVACLFCGCRKGPDKYEVRESAVALYNQGDYAGAITAFNEALEASGGEVTDLQYDILKYRAECEIRTGDYVAAKKTYGALVELDQESGDHERAAQILAELGALDEIKDAAELVKEGNYADAYDAFKAYAKLDGTLTGQAAVYNQAICAEYMGNYEEAYETLSRYLEMYPDDEAAKKEAEFCRTRRKE